MKTYQPFQFALFRILFGAYLFFYFILLIPYAPDLYSSTGMFASLGSLSPFPNLLNVLNEPVQVQGVLLVFGAVSISYLLGFYRRVCALLLWYGWACLINRTPYFTVPSEGICRVVAACFYGCAFGRALSLSKRNEIGKWPKSFMVPGA